jgi:hypothetical protein
VFFELRSYDLKPGKAPVYLEFFRSFGLALVTRHLPMGGYWMAESGRLNRIEHLWIYDSFEERDACRATLSQDAAWMTDFVPKAFADVVAQENRIMALDQASAALDAVIGRRREAHANDAAGTPIFAPGLMALGLSAVPLAPEGLIGRFRVLSGDAPGRFVTLSAGAFDLLTRDTDGLDTHELLRPLSCSPLGGTRN